MKTTAAVLLLALTPLGIESRGFGQTPTMTDASLREISSALATKYKNGEADAAMKEFDKIAKERFGDVDVRPVSVYYSEAISVLAIGPYYNYRSSLRDKIRKMESVEDVHYEDTVGIGVLPSTIQAPDFAKVVVRRDGQIVPPTTSTFESRELKTRMGVAFNVHGGELFFPASAFAPGAAVTVTLIPESGRNIEKKFSDTELKRLRQ